MYLMYLFAKIANLFCILYCLQKNPQKEIPVLDDDGFLLGER